MEIVRCKLATSLTSPRSHNPYLKTLRRSIAESRPYGVSIGSRDPLRVTLPPLGDTIYKGGAI